MDTTSLAEQWGFNHITDMCKTLLIPLMNCSCDKLTMFFGTQDRNSSFCSPNAPENLEKHLRDVRKAEFSIVLPLLATIVALLGTLGNSIVVWVQISVVGVKNKHSALITLLAVCDLLFALLALVYYIPKLLTNQWLYGEVGCKVIGSAHTVGKKDLQSPKHSPTILLRPES